MVLARSPRTAKASLHAVWSEAFVIGFAWVDSAQCAFSFWRLRSLRLALGLRLADAADDHDGHDLSLIHI